jgi:hypothetical protein
MESWQPIKILKDKKKKKIQSEITVTTTEGKIPTFPKSA